jgi:bacterial/archaeal transporter family-2 protein
MIYYFFAVFSGFIVIFNLVVNSRLAKKTDIYLGTFSNYLFGSAAALVLVLIMGEDIALKGTAASPAYYFAGVFGVAIVVIYNAIIHKIPLIYSTILGYIGQMTMGAVIDIMLGNAFTPGRMIGLTLISAGFLYNMNIDKKLQAKIKTQGNAVSS